MPTNKEAFEAELTKQYEKLKAADDPEYGVLKRMEPAELARRITQSLKNGLANKDGKGITRACKALGIKHTYGAIETYLRG